MNAATLNRRPVKCPVCEVAIIWTGPNTGTCVCTGDER